MTPTANSINRNQQGKYFLHGFLRQILHEWTLSLYFNRRGREKIFGLESGVEAFTSPLHILNLGQGSPSPTRSLGTRTQPGWKVSHHISGSLYPLVHTNLTLVAPVVYGLVKLRFLTFLRSFMFGEFLK